jgi:hypothetical protein
MNIRILELELVDKLMMEFQYLLFLEEMMAIYIGMLAIVDQFAR